MGERDLVRLLRGMKPVLSPEAYGYAIWASKDCPDWAFATVAEAEGLTVVAPLDRIRASGMVSEPWARISLAVESDLAAVGLTAAFATALGERGISCNVIAGFHHDHLFVQWDRRDEAVLALEALSRA
jgi:hypothetical protein